MTDGNKMKKLGESRWLWLAGILDGEGTFTMIKRNRKELKLPTYEVDVSITTVTRNLFVEVQRQFKNDGRVNIQGPYGPYNGSNSKPFYRIHFSGSMSRVFLPKLLPYLVVKKRQAELLIEALDVLRNRTRTPVIEGFPGGREAFYSAMREGGRNLKGYASYPRSPRLEEIYQEMARLNRRGVA